MADLSEAFRAIGFDLDGTLVDTMPDLTAAVNLMLGMLDAPQLSDATVRTLVGGGVEMLVQRALNASLGSHAPHPAQSAAALTLFGRLYSQALFERSRMYPGVEGTLRSFLEQGVQLCCITNKNSRFALPLLEQSGLRQFFAFTLCADRAEDRKPSPSMLLAACSRLAIGPAQMLYVGDSRIDIAAARAAACGIAVVSYGYDRPELLAQAAPDAIVDAFADLSTLRRPAASTPSDLERRSTGVPS